MKQKEKQKEGRIVVTVPLGIEEYARISELARNEERSISAQIRYMLKKVT